MILSGQLWKFATGGAAIIAVGLGIGLTYAHIENRVLRHRVEVVEASITDPKTGYVARLAQSETNVATVTEGLKAQNTALAMRAAVDTRNLVRVTAQLKDIQRDNRKKDIQIQRFLALPPTGSTLEDRYSDIDRRILETLP
jgi:hypothetical protein